MKNSLLVWSGLLFVLTVLPAQSAEDSFLFSGTVLDRDAGNVPVAGALVAFGHTVYRTVTGDDGRFSISVPVSVAGNRVIPARPRVRSDLSVMVHRAHRTIDLSNADVVTSVSLYRLDGSRLFFMQRSENSTVMKLPQLPAGLYLIALTLDNGVIVSRSMVDISGAGPMRIVLPATGAGYRTAQATAAACRLIFRHDRYFPHDTSFTGTAGNLSIGLKQDPAWPVFDESKVHTWRFTVALEDSLTMEHEATKENYIPGDFYCDDSLFGKVGIRYKGSDYSLNRCFDSEGKRAAYSDCRTVSIKVKFNEYGDTLRFHTLKKINLHSMSWDDSKMREIFAYRLFRDAGVYTCRTSFVKVYINGVYRGLFTAVENIDGRFTKSRWPSDGDGNLYKECWPWRTLSGYYRDGLETNEDPEDSADVRKMVNFAKAINSATPQTFTSAVTPFIDINYWLNYLVVDRLINNSDGIMTWYVNDDGSWEGNHNYYFYDDTAGTGRFWIIPWDLNATLGKTDYIIEEFDVPEWNVVPESCEPVTAWGGDHIRPPNCIKLIGLTAATLWPEFTVAGMQFLDRCFKPETMKKRLAELSALIAPAMENDPNTTKKEWSSAVDWLSETFDVLDIGFRQYLEGKEPVVDTTGFFSTTNIDSGFRPSGINNFEFTPSEGLPSWAGATVCAGSVIAGAVSTIHPLWGSADFRLSFSLYPVDTTRQYTEWIKSWFMFPAAADLSGLDTLSLCLKSNAPRYCRISLLSDAYGNENSDIRYGWNIRVTAKNRQISLPMADCSYVPWPALPDGVPDLLDSVTATVTGIGIDPAPRFDSAGELEVVPDSGYLQIDNVRFIYRQ